MKIRKIVVMLLIAVAGITASVNSYAYGCRHYGGHSYHYCRPNYRVSYHPHYYNGYHHGCGGYHAYYRRGW